MAIRQKTGDYPFYATFKKIRLLTFGFPFGWFGGGSNGPKSLKSFLALPNWLGPKDPPTLPTFSWGEWVFYKLYTGGLCLRETSPPHRHILAPFFWFQLS